MSLESDGDGPTPHAVSLARGWLNIGGLVWLGFAGAAFVLAGGDEPLVVVAFATVGLLHFVVAHFGSRRVAVLFAMFGP